VGLKKERQIRFFGGEREMDRWVIERERVEGFNV